MTRMDWSAKESPTIDDIRALAESAFAGLPPKFRALAGGIVFMVQEFPDEDVIEEMQLDSEFDILGLFQGPDLAAHHGSGQVGGPTFIFLYRRPLLDYWCENEEPLGHIVRHVLIHEIGHHFGLSDDAMEAIEES
jgi:predicted Zn-dependent protease with MMP-like domain